MSATSFFVTRLNPVNTVMSPPMTISKIAKVLIYVFFRRTEIGVKVVPTAHGRFCRDDSTLNKEKSVEESDD